MQGCEFRVTGPSGIDDSLFSVYVKNAIVLDLNEKGITQDKDAPDLLIDFHMTFENQSMVVYHDDEDNQNYYEPFPEMETIVFLKGTMVIDIVDARSERMVWRSQAVRYMDIHPEISEKNISNGFSRALRDFPPGL